jgi:alkylation response protein AidB-like acyl-CoA dehydrogenase
MVAANTVVLIDVDEALAPHEKQAVQAARTFRDEHVTPFADGIELRRETAISTLRLASQYGLLALQVATEHGGGGLSAVAAARVYEEIAEGCLAHAFSLEVHNNIANLVSRRATREQQERWLPRLLSGDAVAAFCLTEPSTGSDAAAIRCLAHHTGNDWVLNGEKAWVTNAAEADLFAIWAQTDAAAGWRGIAAFLVEREAEGLTVTDPYQLMGGHAMGTAGILLRDCRVSADGLISPPGEAFKLAMEGITSARIFVSAQCCGILNAGLERAISYVSERKAFGRPVGSFQGLQWKLVDVATQREAARLLVYRAAAAADKGLPATVEAAQAKKFATAAAVSGLATCMQVMGAHGFLVDSTLGRHLATAKMAEYLDGTSEIQNVVVARSLLGGAFE